MSLPPGPATMKYQAIIFDLVGTLVDIFSRREYDRVLGEMAAALTIPPREFSQAWISGGDARTMGTVISPMGSLLEVCRALRFTPAQAQLELASQARLNYYLRNLKPRPDAVEVLTELKQRGHVIGLISNCATEMLASWQESPLSRLIESPVFSCSVGLKKPDHRIYEMAASTLGVRPQACFYVADGDNGELQGATDVGMHAVCIRAPYEVTGDSLRVNEEDWQGTTITSLRSVLGMADAAS